jgi:feruloyl esterase
VDGIVSNPTACTANVVNIGALRCPGGVDRGDSCLSDAQLAVVRVWTSNVKYRGSSTYKSKGYNLTGNEDDPFNFGFFASGNGDVKKSAHFLFQDTTVKNYLARDPNADSLAYQPWDRDPDSLAAMAALNDATQTDIRPFINHGGKLIVWHGGADPGLSVNTSINYIEDVRKSVGAKLADAATRLYVAPGVDHCQAGPGADQVDLLSALDQWVIKGVGPATLTAKKLDESGAVLFSRPLCRYPMYPRYTGPLNDAAAAKLASSYTCTSPGQSK